MKSTILIKLKWLDRYFNVLIVYFVCYNTYFGWNQKPINDYEMYCDIILQCIFGFLIGKFIHVVLTFIGLVTNYIKNETFKNK